MRAHTYRTIAAVLIAICAVGSRSQTRPPQYPEWASIPRSLTTTESAWLRENPWYFGQADGEGSPPTCPVHCASEYEPMDGLLMAWEGSASWKNILAAMAGEITSPVGDASVYMVVYDQSEQNDCNTTLTNAGVDMSHVFYVVRPTDTIWIRDYGPGTSTKAAAGRSSTIPTTAPGPSATFSLFIFHL
ncbi:MAG: agmatine deiminase family protein [Armatimonadetes bacterium]|nr:agmatine deiminase family protein [Armatimonadota bacterium]